MLIDKRGPRAKPVRVIPAAAQQTDRPEHLELREGTIDTLAARRRRERPDASV